MSVMCIYDDIWDIKISVGVIVVMVVVVWVVEIDWFDLLICDFYVRLFVINVGVGVIWEVMFDLILVVKVVVIDVEIVVIVVYLCSY